MPAQTLIPLLMSASFVVVMVAVVGLARSKSRKAREYFMQLAGKMGLTATEVKPVLGFYRAGEASGTVRGKAVRLYTFTTGSGKSTQTWAALSVKPAVPGTLTFALSRRGLVTKLMEAFGAHEVKVGDAAFDKEWFVQTNAPEFFTAALLPELRARLGPPVGKWKLERGVVTYVEPGIFGDLRRCDRFFAALEPACDLADVAEVYAQQPGQP